MKVYYNDVTGYELKVKAAASTIKLTKIRHVQVMMKMIIITTYT